MTFRQLSLRIIRAMHLQYLEIMRHIAQHVPYAIDQAVTQSVVRNY
jgi:hypothetical protein